MATLTYISKLIVALGGLLALFEFLPPGIRQKMDDNFSRNLTWKLLMNVALLTLSFDLLLLFFPVISPYFPLIAFFLFGIISKFSTLHLIEKTEDRGCTYTLVSLLLIILIITFVRPQQLQLFYGCIVTLVVSLLFTIWDGKAYGTHFTVVLIGLLLIGLPSAIGFWCSPKAIHSLIYPYNLIANQISGITQRNFLTSLIIPTFKESEFEKAYLFSTETINARIPNNVATGRAFVWFRNTGAGYLLFFGISVQIIFLVYIWNFLKLLLLSVSIPLMRFSSFLKVTYGLQQSRVPIAGVILTLIGIIFTLILDTIEYVEKN